MASLSHCGLLVSQIVEYLGTAFEEEQVWGLCYEICKRLVDTSNKEPKLIHSTSRENVIFNLDTVYLRKDGSVAFVFDSETSNDEEEENPQKQMKDLGELLSACLKDSAQIGDDLKTLVNHMVQGILEDTHGHWVHVVSDRCGHHASCQATLPSKYYRLLCKDLVREATEMSMFLEVIKNEVTLLRSFEAVCTIELYQAKGTLKKWLKVMREVRQTNKSIESIPESPQSPFCASPNTPFPPVASLVHLTLPATPDTKPAIINTLINPEGAAHLDFGKPSFYSTPFQAKCTSTKKILRPPQRLVDEVTSWMLETDEKNSPKTRKKNLASKDNTSKSSTPGDVNGPILYPGYSPSRKSPSKRTRNTGYTYPDSFDSRNLYPNKWTELDSQGGDTSWLSSEQYSTMSPSERWFYEIVRIRGVLTAIQLDTDMEEESLFEALNDGKICFCCRQVKFSIFGRMGISCDICERKVCSACTVHVRSRELGFDSRDCLITHKEKGIMKQIRQVFKTKRSSQDEYADVCKDCRDFVQKFC